MPALAPISLLLLSSDADEEHTVRSHLDGILSNGYTLHSRGNFDKLSESDISEEIQVILLDMRIDREQTIHTINKIGKKYNASALICICRNHEQFKTYGEVMHLVDDYVVPHSLMEGELAMRITHSIRRRNKEHELRHESDLYQSLIDNIPDSIYFKDLDSRFTKVNKAMAEVYGQDVESLLGLTDFDLFTDEHARPAFEDEQRIIKTAEPLIGKVEKETFDDGRVNWVTTTKLPLYNRSREIIGTMGISRNITDLKSIEDALQAERNLLRTILSNLPDQIFVKNTKGRYLVSNPHHTAVLGAASESKVIGTTVYDHMPKPFADQLHKQDLSIIKTNRPLINQVAYTDDPADETRTWYLISKVPLISTTGETIGIIGISRDITDQKENEYKLRRTIHVLKDTQMQLLEAEKLKTVGRLAAGVAHEVKNPLTVIQGNALRL
ncbi:MAG: PAS domain-containing protein, partial [Coraliomargarita sp.]